MTKRQAQAATDDKAQFKNPNYKTPSKFKNLKQLLPLHARPKDPLAVTYQSIEAPPSFTPKQKYCDITGLPSNYQDPRTKLYYRSHEEYQYIQHELNEALIHQYIDLRRGHAVLK
ncbi:hypothetical protein MP228_010867 [Amoeboaphelidium protococcarum]|nr:hypothetical protein MP228_010867 [Amoeboaphelidium protococcarum]